MTAASNDQSLVLVARALKTRGLKGEIVAELLTDFPERFEKLEELFAVSRGGEQRILKLDNHWFQKGRVVLKFENFDTPESAEALIGCEFAVPESERVALPEGHFFDWELEGCAVSSMSGEIIGQVQSVLKTGAAPVLIVKSKEGSEKLIPLAESVIKSIDPMQKVILIDPPDGLLEL